MTDIEIVTLCQNWQLDSFWELYERYVDKIYKFIYLKTYDTDLSQDLTSQTFLKALDNINKFKVEENANFNAWIYRIAYNLIVDNYKKEEKKSTTNIDEILEIWYSLDFAQDIDNKDKLKEILNYFDTLKEKHKQILLMRLWEDLSYKEISEITWESVANCKKIVSRTLAKIPSELMTLLFILLLNI